MSKSKPSFQTCPSCDSDEGIREILYGLPDGPVDENKFAIGGCCVTGSDPIWTCMECGWSGWSLKNDQGTKLSRWKCPLCESIGKIRLIHLDDETYKLERKHTYKVQEQDGKSSPNSMCLKCGWTTVLVRTYSY